MVDRKSLLCERHRVGWCVKDSKCIISHVWYGRSHELDDTLKLFDELPELDVVCLISVITVPVNNKKYMNDLYTMVFDPGGMIFSLLPRYLSTLFRISKDQGGRVFDLAAILIHDTCFPVLDSRNEQYT